MDPLKDEKAVKADRDLLYLGNLNTVESDLKLPEKGRNGSLIFWKSGNDRLLGPDGKVTRPKFGMGSRDVVLTAVLRRGSAEIEKNFTVHILEEKNRVKIRKVQPVRVEGKAGESFYLPSVAIAETLQNGVIAQPVKWEGGMKKNMKTPDNSGRTALFRGQTFRWKRR